MQAGRRATTGRAPLARSRVDSPGVSTMVPRYAEIGDGGVPPAVHGDGVGPVSFPRPAATHRYYGRTLRPSRAKNLLSNNLFILTPNYLKLVTRYKNILNLY